MSRNYKFHIDVPDKNFSAKKWYVTYKKEAFGNTSIIGNSIMTV